MDQRALPRRYLYWKAFACGQPWFPLIYVYRRAGNFLDLIDGHHKVSVLSVCELCRIEMTTLVNSEYQSQS